MKLQSKKILVGCCIGITIFVSLLLSCEKRQKLDYWTQFNLSRFRVEKFDLFNPILNIFKTDSQSQKEHPGRFKYDAYFNQEGKVCYAYFNAHDYGYLMEFVYEKDYLSKVEIHPIQSDSIDNHENSYINKYFYLDGKLQVYRDQLNDEIIILDKDGVGRIYTGILTAKQSFSVMEIASAEYFVELLH
jgi:hypothetical protein